jgi:multiple sugar transport system substrate-binding protein
MIKKLSLLLALILLASGTLLWATGKGEEKKTEVPEGIEWVVADRIGNPNAKIELSYGVTLTYSHQVDTPSRKEYLTKASEEWAKAHPNVKLVLRIQGGTEAEILAKQLEEAATGTHPDFFQLDGQWVPLFYKWLQPIDEYVSKEDLADWFDWTKKEAMIDPSDGKLKGLWFTTNCVGLWYRKDLIPDPPKDWDSFIKTAKDLMTKQGFATGILAYGYQEQIPYGVVLPMFYGLGGNLVDSNGAPIYGKGKDRDAMIEVMSFWDRCVKEGVVPQRILDLKATGDVVAEAAKEKTSAMFLGGSWFLSRMQDVLKNELDKWDFTFTPQKRADMKGQVPGGYNWVFFVKDKEKLKLAVDFVQHVYTSKKGMASWCSAAGYTPLRKSILKEDPRFSQDRWQLAFAEVVQAGRIRPGVPAYPVISEHLQEAWQNVILGRQTPTEAVDRAYEKTLKQIK